MDKSIYSAECEILRHHLIGIRRRAGLTQRQLAERLGRERSFIARLELGERRLDLIEFRRYCEACDVSAVNQAKRIMLDLDRLAHGGDLKVAEEKADPMK